MGNPGIRLLTSYVECGKYLEMRKYKFLLGVLKARIQKYQEDMNIVRFEWREQGVVGKFVTIHQYEYQDNQLKEYLSDHGVLPRVVTINWNMMSDQDKDCLKQWVLYRQPYIRFSPTGELRSEIQLVESRCDTHTETITAMVSKWRETKTRRDSLCNEFNQIKQCLALHLGPQTSYELRWGSVVGIGADPHIPANEVYQELGIDAVFRYGKVDSERLLNYYVSGLISKKVVEGLRKVSEAKLRYVLMELHKEQVRNEQFRNRVQALLQDLLKFDN